MNTWHPGEICIPGLGPKICKMCVGHIAKLESKEVTNLQRYIGPCKQDAVTISLASSHISSCLYLASFTGSSSLTWCLNTEVTHGSVLGPGLWSGFNLTLGYFGDPHGSNNHLYFDAFQMHVSPAPPLSQIQIWIHSCLLGTSTHMSHGCFPSNEYKLIVFPPFKLGSSPLFLHQ